MDVYTGSSNFGNNDKKQLIEQITGHNNKLTKARELLLNEEIESADYRLIKSETESKIRVLEARISEMRTDFVSLSEVEKTLDKAIKVLTAIDVIYCKSDSSIQRKIIGSMYPEKFTFEDLQHRTAKVSDSFQVIYLINSQLTGKKNGTNDVFSHLSHQVIPLVQNSNFLLEDLKLLSDLLAA